MFQDLGNDYHYELELKDQPKANHTISTKHLSEALECVSVSIPLFVIIKSLFRYWKYFTRYPNQENIEELKKIKDNIVLEHKISSRELRKCDYDKLVEIFVGNIGCELSPVCAVVGGVVAQEILKIICHNDKPFNNTFFFNGMDDSGMVGELNHH